MQGAKINMHSNAPLEMILRNAVWSFAVKKE